MECNNTVVHNSMILTDYMKAPPKIHELSLENLKTKEIEDNKSNTPTELTNIEQNIHLVHSKMVLDAPPILNKSNKSSSNTLLPSSPTSFKVSPSETSETSEDTNETSPSSIGENETTMSDLRDDVTIMRQLNSDFDDETIRLKIKRSESLPMVPKSSCAIKPTPASTAASTTSTKSILKEHSKVHIQSSSQHSLLSNHNHQLQHDIAVNTSVKNNHVHYLEIDPLLVPEDSSNELLKASANNDDTINSQNFNSNNSITSSHSTSHMKNRRHTTPASIPKETARNSLDSISGSRFVSKPPLSRNTFPSASSSSNIVNKSTIRTRNSIDSYSRNDSTNSEILRMRNSILMKRNLKKKRREFLEDEKVLVGNKISEGHENFVMAYNMLTGIRVAVSRCSGVMKKITDEDFSTTKKLSFNMDGSELTPSSKYDFKFKDYSPEVFRDLRSTFGLDPADYLVSITGKYILSELGSPGKSGSFFYFSRDYRFIIKTIHHSEHKQLRKILKVYYEHVKSNPNTLISQIYGLHRVKIPAFGSGSNGGSTRKVHFLVMNNLFPPHRDIHVKYDLKGSTWGRITKFNETQELNEPNNSGNESMETELTKITLKDLNWLERDDKIKFGPMKKKLFFDQLESDVKFLKQANVMDYSLLLGVHYVKKGNSQTNERLQKLSVFDPILANKSDLINTNPRDIDRMNDLPSNVFPGRSQYVFYGHDGGIRATNENDEPMGEIYYLGIIDCLTNYSVKKKLETFWRSLSHPRQTISALPAKEYGDRFLRFIKGGVESPKKKVD